MTTNDILKQLIKAVDKYSRDSIGYSSDGTGLRQVCADLLNELNGTTSIPSITALINAGVPISIANKMVEAAMDEVKKNNK